MYAGAFGDYWRLWERTSARQVLRWRNRLPHYERMRQNPIAQLTAYVSAIGGGATNPADFYTGYATIDDDKPKKDRYSLELVSDVELAFALGMLAQPVLVALNPEKLRNSGAWR